MRQINLVPIEIQQKYRRRVEQRTIFVTMIAVLSMSVALHLMLTTEIKTLKKALASKSASMNAPQIDLLVRGINELKNQRKDIFSSDPVLSAAMTHGYVFSNLLKKIGSISSGRVWFNSMVIDSQKGIFTLKGQTYATRSVSEFMLDMKKLGYCEAMDVSSIAKHMESEKKEIDFEIVCMLQ